MELVFYIVFAIFTYWISGLVHEFGHIFVGLVNSWKFHLIVVGPIGLKRNADGKLQFYYEKNIILWGGVGATLPTKDNPENLNIWKKVLIGGPLASIIMGVIFLPIGLSTSNLYLLLLGAMPLGMGIMCALPLPIRTGILYTDGGRIARLNTKGQKFLEEKALFEITQSMNISNNLNHVDFSDIENLIKSEDPAIKYFGYYYSAKYFSERNNKDQASDAINIITF
jgi:hypothetical protein